MDNPELIDQAGPGPEIDNKGLRSEIESAINRASAESGSDTPDFILAEYLTECLAAFDKAVCAREKWYGRKVGEIR